MKEDHLGTVVTQFRKISKKPKSWKENETQLLEKQAEERLQKEIDSVFIDNGNEIIKGKNFYLLDYSIKDLQEQGLSIIMIPKNKNICFLDAVRENVFIPLDSPNILWKALYKAAQKFIEKEELEKIKEIQSIKDEVTNNIVFVQFGNKK